MKNGGIVTILFVLLVSLSVVVSIESEYVGEIVSSRKVENIDDSEPIQKFNILGLNSISFDVSSSKTLTTKSVKKISLEASVENIYEFSNLKVETVYEEVDTGFFNVDEKPVKQSLKITNLLNEDVDINFDLKYSVNDDKVVWNGTEYEITENPQFFEAFEIEIPELEEIFLTGHTLYFGDNYLDFKDITNLDYLVSVYSEDGKNYIGLQLNLKFKPLEIIYIDPEIGWTTHIITTSAGNAKSVYAIDMDNDGDVDVLSAASGAIAWYENDGGSPPSWTTHTITYDVDYGRSVFAIDMDNDGDVDVLSASAWDDKVAWYENDGGSPIGWTTHVITYKAYGAWSVFAVDIDDDNDVDVLSASYEDDKIVWYENNGSEFFTGHVITTSADCARSVYAIDLDADTDVDVLSASNCDSKVAWYENDGSEYFTEHIITTSAYGAFSVFASDIDNDDDMDVLSAAFSGDEIAWFENDGSEYFTKHVITTSANAAGSVYAIDLDGDDDVDVLSASGYDNKVAWYENDGNEYFTEHNITTSASYVWSVFATDLDGDDDVDVLSASTGDNKIAWYENELIVPVLQITDIIPIQVVKDVDLVKDKSGIVRVVIESSEDNVNARVRLFFEGELVESEKEVVFSEGPNDVDFNFKPDKSGTNLKLRAEVEEI